MIGSIAERTSSPPAEVRRKRMVSISPKWMYVKAALFLVIGGMCLSIIVMESPRLTTVICSALMIWAFCRAYYFAFYVVEHYIDEEYRFAGLLSFVEYAARKRGELGNTKGNSPDSGVKRQNTERD